MQLFHEACSCPKKFGRKTKSISEYSSSIKPAVIPRISEENLN
jgi:hypothetical protein